MVIFLVLVVVTILSFFFSLDHTGANIRGGEFWMRKTLCNGAILDKWWNSSVMALVGCPVKDGDEITGARVVVDERLRVPVTQSRMMLHPSMPVD